MTTAQRLPISVCLIAGNRARRIRRALESVAGWTGEIIVVTDPNVTDGTEKIAQTYGAKIFCEPWQGHAVHRNLASERATQPWLLAIDADEVVSRNYGMKFSGILLRTKPRLPRPSACPDALFTRADGFAMAIGIRTAKCGFGSAGAGAGRAALTKNSSSKAGLAGCAANCCITAWNPLNIRSKKPSPPPTIL